MGFEERSGNQLRGEPRERRPRLKVAPAVGLPDNRHDVIQRLRASSISTGQDDFLVMGNQDFALSEFKDLGCLKAVLGALYGSCLEPRKQEGISLLLDGFLSAGCPAGFHKLG